MLTGVKTYGLVATFTNGEVLSLSWEPPSDPPEDYYELLDTRVADWIKVLSSLVE